VGSAAGGGPLGEKTRQGSPAFYIDDHAATGRWEALQAISGGAPEAFMAGQRLLKRAAAKRGIRAGQNHL